MPRIRSQDTPALKWRVGGYIRLSREDGEDESLSVTNQKKIIEDYFLQTLEKEAVLVGLYIDDGLTGTGIGERHAFLRLIRAVESGEINCVLCKSLSRAFRNYADQGRFLEDFFPKHGTRFISITSPFVDSFLHPEAISGMEVPITGLMNDRFAAQTSEQIRKTFATKRTRGEFIGAFAPYGYAKDPKDKNKLIIDPGAAEIVLEAFRLFVYEGYSLGGIARHFNARGIPNPTAYKKEQGLRFAGARAHQNDGLWSAVTLRRMLSNQVYIGHMVQGRQRAISYKVHQRVHVPESEWFIRENTHAPIIAPELFEKAQALLKTDTRTPNDAGTVHLFAGLLRCHDCQKAMMRSHARGQTYYICKTYSQKSKAHCTRHSIREDQLTRAVLAALKMQLSLLEMAEIVSAAQSLPPQKAHGSDANALLKKHRAELARLRNTTAGLYHDWKNNVLTEDEYLHMKAQFDGQISRITAITNTLAREATLADDAAKAPPLLSMLLAHANITSLERGLLIALVEQILIHENGRVTLRLGFSRSFPP